MSSLDSALGQLSATATLPDGNPQHLLTQVRAMLGQLPADSGICNRLLNHFAELIAQTDGPRASALAIGCGALVENGGDPDIALLPMLEQLPELLAGALVFHNACAALAHAVPEDQEQPSPVQEFGQQVQREMPGEALAWLSLGPLCTGAIALLSRSVEGRRQARQMPDLLPRVFGMASNHPRVGFLAQLLQVLDDEPLLVLHPRQQRGYRVRITGIADNFQLHTLLAAALLGDPQKGWLMGKRPDPRVVLAARDQPVDPGAKVAEGAFNLWTWQGLQPDGTLPEGMEGSDFWVWNEGIPADIPPFEGVRTVLLGPQPYPRSWNAGRCFDGLHADLRVEEQLTSEVVRERLQRIAAAPKGG
jgi:hypothetical protein